MPPMLGTNNIAEGSIWEMIWASWPAPEGIDWCRPGA
jgi:hypothetical protein